MYNLRKVEDVQKYYEFLYRGGVSTVFPHVVKILDDGTVKYSSATGGIKYISNVPEGYAQVEYIESPGNTKTTAAYIQLDKTYDIFEEMIELDFMSYIDTQIYLYISNHFRLLLNKYTNSSGNWLQFISTSLRKPDLSGQHMAINLGNYSNYENIRFKFTMYYNSSDGKIYMQIIDVINDIVLLHKETSYNTSIPISDYDFSNDHILIGGGAPNAYYLNGRIYGFKISPISILNGAPVTSADEVCHYIPVIRLSDNTAGLLERISNGSINRNTTRNFNWTFYPSTSSIPFIAGPMVKPNISYLTMNSEDIGSGGLTPGGGLTPSSPIVIP